VPLYYKKRSFINNLNSFNDVAGRTNTSGGLHAARVFETPASEDHCERGKKYHLKKMLESYFSYFSKDIPFLFVFEMYILRICQNLKNDFVFAKI